MYQSTTDYEKRANEIMATNPALFTPVLALAESLGYGVVELRLPRDIPKEDRLNWGGRCSPADKLIIVNEELPLGPRAFALAHEIGHMRLHGHYGISLNQKSDRRLRDLLEAQADRYAHLLCLLVGLRLARTNGTPEN